jgi:hypothetical protein
MDALAHYRYDAVRYAPYHSAAYPFQVVGGSKQRDISQTAIVQLTLEQAKDLHASLGAMIQGVENVKN